MGKYIYEDKQTWKEHLLKNYNTFNMMMGKNWSDEQINKMVEDRINDTQAVERYKKAVEFKNKEIAGQAILDEYQAEFLKTHTEEQWAGLNGFSTFMYCKLDLSGAPGSKEKNFEIMSKYTDRKWAMKEVMRQFKKILSVDITKFRYNTPEEGFKLLEDNYDLITTCFSLDRMFAQIGKYQLNPELKEFYQNHKKLIETISSPLSMQNVYSNPGKLLIPNENFLELMSAGPMLSKNSFDLIGKIEGFSLKDGSIDLEDSVSTACIRASNEQVTMVEERDCFALIGKEAPKDILTNYKCALVNGEKVTLYNGLSAIQGKKGKVEFVKYTQEEMAKINNALDHALLDQPAMIDAGKQLRDLGSTLGKTDHWYNWNNTPEFKNLLTALKELPTSDSEYKNMDKLTKNFEKIQDLAQKYIDKKNDKTLNKNGDARLEICKNILDLTKKTLSDDFFHKIVPNPEPGMTRTQIDFTNELLDDVEEYEDILDDSMEKAISFEKGSREEQEFFKE